MRRGLVFSLMLLWGAATAHTQIRIRVVVRNPAPAQLSTWQTDPSVVRIEIINQGAELAAMRLSGEIRADNGGLLLRRMTQIRRYLDLRWLAMGVQRAYSVATC